MPTFQMTGFEQFGQKFKDRIKSAIGSANEQAAQTAQNVANLAIEYCPEAEGKLASTIEVVQSESGLKQGRDEAGRFSSEAIITYTVKAGGPDTPHVLAVHENPSKHDPPTWKGKNVNFRKGGSHFLARAFRDSEGDFKTRIGKKLFVLILCVVSVLIPDHKVLAQEVIPDKPETSNAEAQQSQMGAFGAVWCRVVSKKEQKPEVKPIDPNSEELIDTPTSDESDQESSDFNGCDAGFAASLTHFGRLHIVAVIGTSSIGTGFAWSIAEIGAGNRPMAVAIGVMANYDSKGIYSDTLALTLGATISLRGSN